MSEMMDIVDIAPKPSLLRRLVGWPYGQIMRVRRWAYHKGLLGSQSVDVPVICVGNITCGGTGKTPMVAWVVRQLKAMGKTPAILTRGYKAVHGRSDEAELLKQLTDAAVVVNPDRIAGARQAIDDGADVLVMDDGYQHMRLRRDLNLVLIDATNPFGGGSCLPAGLLREPLDALRDTQAVVITRSDNLIEGMESLKAQIACHTDAPIYAAAHTPVSVVLPDGTTEPPDALSGKLVFLFCGLGNPEGFLMKTVALGAKVVGSLALEDHADYSPERIIKLNEDAKKCEAEAFLTTQKDGVKLSPDDFDLPLWQLAVEMDVTTGAAELCKQLADLVDAPCPLSAESTPPHPAHNESPVHPPETF